jgi:LPXTG-motif cell wall-anchored protein
MKKLVVFLLVAAFAFSLSTQAAAAQTATAAVTGKAVRWNGEPIAGATIAALAGPLETDKVFDETTTAADGSYTLAVPAGQVFWVHIRTFGSWWGYSYNPPFNLRPSEQISQVFFALGPRDVKESITLPTPVSNVGPETGTAEPPPAEPPAAAPPVSNTKPIVGTNEPTTVKQPAKTSQAKPLTGGYLPQTGGETTNGLWLALGLALAGVTAGLGMRRYAWSKR